MPKGRQRQVLKPGPPSKPLPAQGSGRTKRTLAGDGSRETGRAERRPPRASAAKSTSRQRRLSARTAAHGPARTGPWGPRVHAARVLPGKERNGKQQTYYAGYWKATGQILEKFIIIFTTKNLEIMYPPL